MSSRLALALLLPACAEAPPGPADTGSDGYLYHETGDAPGDDSADTAEPGDTAADAALVALDLYPARVVVMPGATWTYRAVGTRADGSREEVEIPAGPAKGVVAIAAGGLATALAAGEQTVSMGIGDLAATATVVVRDEPVAEVTVVNALDGSPIEGASVALPLTAPVTVDADGFAKLPVPDGGPQQITAWMDESWSAVTISGTVQRVLTIALTPRDGGGYDSAIAGTVDWTGLPEPDADELAIGLAGASLPRTLASLDIDRVFGENRAVELFGTQVSAPANLFVRGYVEDWSTAAMSGPAAAWGLAGIVKTEDALALGNPADALDLLDDAAADFEWAMDAGLQCTAGATASGHLAPGVGLSDELAFELPDPPLGIDGGEDWFLAAAEEADPEGWIVTGIGVAKAGPATLLATPAGSVGGARARAVLAVAQAGGIGSGQGTSAVVAEVGGEFPAPLPLPTLATWNPETRALVASAEGANLVLLRLTDKKHHVHDVVAPGAFDGTMPAAIDEMARGQATLEATATFAITGHFEDWVRSGDVDPATKDAAAVSRNRRTP